MQNPGAFMKTLVAIAVTLVLIVLGRDQVFSQSGTWIAKAPIPTPRVGLAVGVANPFLYAVGGGMFTAGAGGGWEYLPTVEAYDPSTNSWSSKAPMPTPRTRHTVGVVNGILYVVGGLNSQTDPSAASRVDAYDPVRNRWAPKAPLPTPRSGVAVGVAKGTLYVVGGWGPGPTGLVEAYDPITNRWTMKAPMPTPPGELWHRSRERHFVCGRGHLLQSRLRQSYFRHRRSLRSGHKHVDRESANAYPAT